VVVFHPRIHRTAKYLAAVCDLVHTRSLKKRAIELLKLNPDYETFIAGVPSELQDQVAFVRAATWPDMIKKDPHYTNDGDDNSVPNSSLNIGYRDNLQHRYWHFIDLPFSTDGSPLIEPKPPNAETRIELFRQTIASNTATDDVKSYDLAWLLHLVGDVHQPLHDTSRFSHDLPGGDHGGNLVTLCEKPCRDELHAFWDEVLGKSTSAIASINAARKLPQVPADDGADADVLAWVNEGFAIAKQSVYAPPIGEGRGPFMLTDAYKQSAKQIAEARAAVAGVRVAKLLNSSLR
jgi:hypothetical protein